MPLSRRRSIRRRIRPRRQEKLEAVVSSLARTNGNHSDAGQGKIAVWREPSFIRRRIWCSGNATVAFVIAVLFSIPAGVKASGMNQPGETPSSSGPQLFSLAWGTCSATLAFAVMNVFVKQLDRIPAMEIVFFRCLVSGVICGIQVARRRLDWKGNNHSLLIARGTFGTLALFTFFVTLSTCTSPPP